MLDRKGVSVRVRDRVLVFDKGVVTLFAQAIFDIIKIDWNAFM